MMFRQPLTEQYRDCPEDRAVGDGDVATSSGCAGGVASFASCASFDGSRGGRVNAPASSEEFGLKRRGSIRLRCKSCMKGLVSIDETDSLKRTGTGSRSSGVGPKATW